MPVPLNSRYHGLPVHDAPGADGTERPAVAIRPGPSEPTEAAYNHLLTGAEGMEYLAWRFFGSSQAWWRIADANPLVFPTDLRPGTALAIPGAADVGRVRRTRSFG